MKSFEEIFIQSEVEFAKLLIKKLDNKEKLDKLDYLLICEILDTFVSVCSKYYKLSKEG